MYKFNSLASEEMRKNNNAHPKGTKSILCRVCGKNSHRENANYCSLCGTKLKGK